MKPFTPKELREHITSQVRSSSSVEASQHNETGCICDAGFGMNLSCLIHGVADKVDHDSTTPPFPSIQEQERFWKEKEGTCCGCNLSIPQDQQYCHDCESFLTSVYEESRELTSEGDR